MELRKAERKKAKLRLGISGPAGSGKTFSALLIAYGITGDWSKVAVIDTENGSGELYVNHNKSGNKIGEYNIVSLAVPYTPDRYIEAIKLCESSGMECVVIDSLSHAWIGEGGILDTQGKIAEKSGNSWTAWRTITPKHNALVDTMLSSPIHIIATMRSKMEYTQEKDSSGKTIVRKVGMGNIQRDGMEYEFTVFFELDQQHVANTTKDRTSLFDGTYITPSPDTGKQLLAWLDTGAEVVQRPSSTQLGTLLKDVEKLGLTKDDLTKWMKELTGKDKGKELTMDEYTTLCEKVKEAGK